MPDFLVNGPIFSIALGSEYLSYVKFIATRAPTFFGYITSASDSVSINLPFDAQVSEKILNVIYYIYIRPLEFYKVSDLKKVPTKILWS